MFDGWKNEISSSSFYSSLGMRDFVVILVFVFFSVGFCPSTKNYFFQKMRTVFVIFVFREMMKILGVVSGKMTGKEREHENNLRKKINEKKGGRKSTKSTKRHKEAFLVKKKQLSSISLKI